MLIHTLLQQQLMTNAFMNSYNLNIKRSVKGLFFIGKTPTKKLCNNLVKVGKKLKKEFFMSEVDIIKWMLGLITAAIIAVVRAVWNMPEKYVLKEDFNTHMISLDKKLEVISNDIKQILTKGY